MSIGSNESAVIYANLGLSASALAATAYTAAVAEAETDARTYANAAVSAAQAEQSDTDFAAATMANLGMTAAIIGQDAYDALLPAYAAYLNSVGVANRGVVVVQLASIVAGLVDDATFGAAAQNLVSASSVAYAYSTDAANTTALAIDVATVPAPDTAFTLTTGTDTLIGTALNDTFTGLISGLASAATLNTTDKINGGAGSDSLNASMAVSWTGFSSGFVKDVEAINLTNTGTTNLTFDATGITGANSFSVTGGSQVELQNLPTGVNTITLSGLKSASGTRTFKTEFDTSAAERAETKDALELTLNGVGNAAVVVSGSSVARQADLELNRFETVNVKVADASFVAFATANDLKTINVAGDKALTVTAVNAAVTKFDASTSTGAVTADLRATTAIASVKTGTGNDAVTIERSGTTGNAILEGGTGTDTLTIRSSASGAAEYNMSGFENIALSAIAGGELTLSGAKTTGVTTISSNNDVAQAVTFVEMGSSDLTFNAASKTANDGTTTSYTKDVIVSSDHSGASVVNYTAAARDIATKTAKNPLGDYSFSKSSNVTINVNPYIDASASSATNGSTVTANEATAIVLNVASGKNTSDEEVTNWGSTVTAGKATSLTVDSKGSIAGSVFEMAKLTSATITNGEASAGTVTLEAPELRTVSITTGNDLTLADGGSNFNKVQTLSFDVSEGTGAIADALAGVSSVTLSGTGTSTTAPSTVSLGVLGTAGAAGTGNAYDLNVLATGLKGGLTINDLRTGDGYNISLDAKGVTGAVTVSSDIGGVTAGTEAPVNVTVNATATGGAVTLKALAGTGTVSVLASGGKQLVLGQPATGSTNITAKNAVVDMTGTTVVSTVSNGTAGYSTYSIGSSLDLKLHELMAAGTHTVNAQATSTGLDVKLQGGINLETVVINSNSLVSSIKVAGDLGAGDDTVAVTHSGAAATIDLSGVASYKSARIEAGAGSDTIIGGAGADTIIAGRGTNVLTGNGGADIFLFNVGDSIHSSVNTITDLSKSQIDKITYGGADITLMNDGTAYSFTSGTTTVSVSAKGVATFAGTAADFDTIIEIAALLGGAANVNASSTAQSGIGEAAFFRLASDSTATYLFISDGVTGAGTGDTIIKLTGVSIPTAEDTISLGTNGDATATGIFGFGA